MLPHLISIVEKLSGPLPAERVADIRATVAERDLASPSEVLRDALRDWKLKRKVQTLGVEEPRALWREGEDDEGAEDGDAEFARLAAKYLAQAKQG